MIRDWRRLGGLLTLSVVAAGWGSGCAVRSTQPVDGTTLLSRTAAVELARSLLGAPYRYGGDDRRGFDCSGFTQHVMEAVGIVLPRTTATQAGVGRWVAPDELSPGDLVFFGESRSKPFHVGIVVSRPGEPMRMVHASTSRGVVETAVTESSYWMARFMYGRRLAVE